MRFNLLASIGLALFQTLPVLCFSSNPSSSSSLSTETASTRYRFRVAYHGAGFQGFQIQNPRSNKPHRTVQGVLEATLKQRLQVFVRVVAAGRTDTGVHARGQACHVDFPNEILPFLVCMEDDDNDNNDGGGERIKEEEEADWLSALTLSMDRMLPDDCCIWNLQRAPPAHAKVVPVRGVDLIAKDDNDEKEEEEESGRSSSLTVLPVSSVPKTLVKWNVMYDSTGKLYSYRLSLGRVMHPLERHVRWHPEKAHTIDPVQLDRILQSFVGTHDFRAFATAMEQLEKKATLDHKSGKTIRINTVRTVYSVTLVDESHDGHYRIDFHLKGALYKQVRNMVKSALDVAQGAVSDELFLQLVHNEHGTLTRKDNPSKPAPPQGLTLEQVYFDNEDGGF